MQRLTNRYYEHKPARERYAPIETTPLEKLRAKLCIAVIFIIIFGVIVVVISKL